MYCMNYLPPLACTVAKINVTPVREHERCGWGTVCSSRKAATFFLCLKASKKNVKGSVQSAICAFARKLNSVSWVTILETSKRVWDPFYQHDCSGEQTLCHWGRGEKLQQEPLHVLEMTTDWGPSARWNQDMASHGGCWCTYFQAGILANTQLLVYDKMSAKKPCTIWRTCVCIQNVFNISEGLALRFFTSKLSKEG